MLRKFLLASVAASGVAGSAHAQTDTPAPKSTPPSTAMSSPAPKSQASPASGQVSDIIVTAQKRTERLNNVAEAVTAFSAERRQVVGIDTLSDFAKFTPGLSYDAGDDRVYLRGVGRETNTAGSDPGVATYTDGIYDSSTASVGQDDFFVDRVEVLRGPQGTLYGRNSIGGAVNAISKRPTDTLDIEGRATVANYDAYIAEGSISGPLTDTVQARLAGSWGKQGEGYFRNLAGGPSEGGVGENYYLEGQIQTEFNANAKLWLKAYTGASDGRPRSNNSDTPYDYGAFPSGALTPGAAFGYLFPGYTALGAQTSNPGVNNIRDFSTNTATYARNKNNYGLQGQFDYHLPAFDVRVLGGYHQYTYSSITDLDDTSLTSYQFPLSPGSTCSFVPGCTPLTVDPSEAFRYLEDRKYGSAEVDFLSNGVGPLRWIGGLYFYGEDLHQGSDFNAPDQVQITAPANGPANPSGDFVMADSAVRTRSYAAFGQVDYDLTSTIRLTGGLRYSNDDKQALESFRAVCLGCAAGLTPDQLGSLTPALDVTSSLASFAPAPGVAANTTIDPTTGIAHRELRGSWSAFTGTAGIEWRPRPDSLLFATYSRGYKSGGFNAGGIIAAPETSPEYIDAYQAGWKQKFGPLQLNLAGYYYSYTNLQIPLTVPTSTIDLVGFYNISHSKSYGIEAEATWQVTPDFQLLANYAWADSSIDACCFYDGADPSAVAPGARPTGPAVGGSRFQNVTGDQLPYLPRNKIALNANYIWRFEPGSVTLSASYVWRDAEYSSIFDRSYYRLPSNEDVDLRLLWTEKSDRYRIIFFAKNLLNSVQYDSIGGGNGNNSAVPYVLRLDPRYTVNRSVSIAPPRTYGVQFQFKY